MDHRLRNGTALEIRPIRSDDKELLAAGFRLLSEESRQMRFLTAKPRLTTGDLRYLTEVDGHHHVALVAVERDHPTHIAAVGRFVRDLARPDTAEFAIVVGDPYQRQGLGRALGRALSLEAQARGIRRFTATVLDENEPVQRLITSIGEHLEYVPQGDGTREIVADLLAA
jgi:RimJ/RimL family protein N-acetyltransferase